MNVVVLLDTGPLGLVTHPNADDAQEIKQWITDLLEAGIGVCVPEIADYELRREYLRRDNQRSIRRLEELEAELEFAPISTPVMHHAAACWARARRIGKPTADDKALDGDMILVAHAAEISKSAVKVVVATSNVGHLATFVDARIWTEITPEAVLS